MLKYRNTSLHPEEVSKGDKRVMLAPGEFIDLGSEDEKSDDNKVLIEEGRLSELKKLEGKGGDK